MNRYFMVVLTLVFSGVTLKPLLRAEESRDSLPKATKTGADYLRELSTRNKDLRTLSVRFRQQKKLRILRRPRHSQGELWYADGRLAMEVRDLKGKVETRLLVEKERLKIYYPRLKRLEFADSVSGKDDGEAPAIPFAPEHWENIERNYDVTMKRTPAADVEKPRQTVTLILNALNEKNPIQKMRIVLVDDQLREYVQVEKSGDEMRMEILAWRRNEPIDAARFDLKVAPGTKRVKLSR